MPIRSPRNVYKIAEITVNLDDALGSVDTAPGQTVGGTKRTIYVKMKESIGDYFGLTPLPWNSADYIGVFKAGGSNQGATFRRNIGGYKDASYKLIAVNTFSIGELRRNNNTSPYIRVNKLFKTMSIGLPKGHSVTEVINWLSKMNNFNQIGAIVTPQGRRVAIHADT